MSSDEKKKKDFRIQVRVDKWVYDNLKNDSDNHNLSISTIVRNILISYYVYHDNTVEELLPKKYKKK